MISEVLAQRLAQLSAADKQRLLAHLLRKKAEQQMGAKFDVRDFHDVVLRDGSLPLELLQGQVEKYIADGR